MEKEFFEVYHLLLSDELQKSDAIVWLQGDRLDRSKAVLQAYRSGLAKIVVISGNNVLLGPKMRPGEDNISLSEMKRYLVDQGVEPQDIIIDSKAYNTKEQAINTIKLAKERKWQSIILANSAYHQPRVILTFLKQMQIADYQLEIFSQVIEMSMDEIPSGRNENVSSLCLNEIKKIMKYKDDLIPIKSGIDYLNKRE